MPVALTQYAVGALEDGPSLSKPHGPAHLARIVFWHLNHLERSIRNRFDDQQDLSLEGQICPVFER